MYIVWRTTERRLYATPTFPTMHLICAPPPPKKKEKKKIAKALLSISLETAVILRRNEKKGYAKLGEEGVE